MGRLSYEGMGAGASRRIYHHAQQATPADTCRSGDACYSATTLYRRPQETFGQAGGYEEKVLVAALIHAGDTVVPAEAVFIEPRPEKANTERARSEDRGEDAAAHCGACGVVVVEGAERGAGVAHAGSRLRQGEEQKLVEQGEYG